MKRPDRSAASTARTPWALPRGSTAGSPAAPPDAPVGARPPACGESLPATGPPRAVRRSPQQSWRHGHRARQIVR
jgi:hypothetical protein